MPALAMPGLPLVLMNQWRSRAGGVLPLPLSTTCAVRVFARARADLMRSACTAPLFSARRRAAHAARAAEDAERAGHAFVEIARPGLEHVAEELGRRHPGCGVLRRQAEVGDADLAAMVGAVERQQAGLQAEERNGVACPDGAAHDPARVPMQAARD